MIKMSMRYKNRVRATCDIFHPIIDAVYVRLNWRAEHDGREIDAREVWIDKQRMPARFKLITVGSQISNAHTSAGWDGRLRICHDKLRISLQSSVKRLR